MIQETILKTAKDEEITQIQPKSVIFIFGHNIDPIACTTEYLFETDSNRHCKPIFPEFAEINNYNTEDIIGTIKYSYSFYNTIRYMGSKFGLINEFYKNRWGCWIDMTAIRENIRLFASLMSVVNSNDRYAYDVADNYVFNNPEENTPYYRYIVDIKHIPETRYILSDKTIIKIGKWDGQNNPTKITNNLIEIKNFNDKDNIDKNKKYFIQNLADYVTEEEANNNIDHNNNHKFDDLMIKLYNADGTPFTQHEDFFITVNGLVVDYTRSSTKENVIYIPNVVKFSDIQMTGLKKGVRPEDYLKYEKRIIDEENLIYDESKTCAYFDFDSSKCKYSMVFNVKIYYWENVSVSHMISPINTEIYPKTEPSSAGIFWLTSALIFSKEVDPNKCILLKNNEIMSNNEYMIDPVEKNKIHLLYINTEFDIIYSEIRRKLNIYLSQLIDHGFDEIPKLLDYLPKKDNPTEEEIVEAMKEYESALEEFKLSEKSDDYYDVHAEIPALQIVGNQFKDIKYTLIEFDSKVNNDTIDIEINREKDKFRLNYPIGDVITSKEWKKTDINIINGLQVTLENLYDNKFKVPDMSYRMNTPNLLEGAEGYRLEIAKVNK